MQKVIVLSEKCLTNCVFNNMFIWASACCGVHILLCMYSLCGMLSSGGAYRFLYYMLCSILSESVVIAVKWNGLLSLQRSFGLGLKVLFLIGWSMPTGKTAILWHSNGFFFNSGFVLFLTLVFYIWNKQNLCGTIFLI